MQTDTAPSLFKPDWRVLAVLGLTLLGSAWLFFDIMEDMVIDDPLVPLDTNTFMALRDLRTTAWDAVMIGITELGDTSVAWAMTIVVALWLAHQKAWRTLAYWIIAIGGGSLINTVIKSALQRARPTELYLNGASAFSFPSGHSTVNAVLYGFLAILVMRQIAPIWRAPVAIGTGTLIAAIAFSRLYLGAHWLSDVAGGLAFGAMWLALLTLVYMYHRAENIEPTKLLAIAGTTLIVAGGVNIALNHAHDTQRYAIKVCCTTTGNVQQIPSKPGP